jgi:hypothetical protein
MAELTDREKITLLQQAFPGIDDKAIAADLPYIKTAKDVQYIIDNEGVLPNQAFWQRNLKGIAKKAELPQAFWMEHPLGGSAVVGGGIAAALGKTSIGKLVAAKFAKKGAETAAEVAGEAIKTKAKMSLGKKVAYGVGGATVFSGVAGQVSKMMGGGNSQTDSTQALIDQNEQQAAALLASGNVDPSTIFNSALGKQLNLNAGNAAALTAKWGYDSNAVSGLGNTGVFTGKTTITPGTWKAPLKPGTKTADVVTPELLSLPQWKKSFPATLAEQQATKQKFVDAGVLDPTAGLKELRAAWDYYGEQSNEYSKAGTKLSPWDILKMQKGLSGSGGTQTSTVIDTSPIAEADVRTLTKSQLAKSLGLSAVDDKTFKDILAIVRKNEAKNPTKTVVRTTGKTTTRNTTPGYGQSDVLADVEAYAKKDPRYADFQTANVFGQGLVQALGLKA